jgi:hypothetical protein
MEPAKKMLSRTFPAIPKKAENRHSEPVAAGEESLLVFPVERGGIRRFAQNNDERTCFGTRSAAEVMQAIFLTIFCASEERGSE